VKLNYQFPTRSVKHWEQWIGERDLVDVAVAAEEAGFDLVSTTDHPFPEQAWIENGGHHAFDPFVALSFMAAATSRIRLLTFILVSGYRNPYLTAKATASLDLLSKGRLIVGMGAGYQKGEFEVLEGAFDDRGARFDSGIAAIRAAWTGDVVDRDDDYYPAHGHAMLPRPAQPSGPPIWIGGNSKAAIRRVGEIADGWLPFEQPAGMSAITTTPELGVEQLGARIDDLRRIRVEHGRPPEFDVCYSPTTSRDPERTVETVLALLPILEQAGATHLSIDSHARSIDECLREIEIFGQTLVRPGTDQAAEAVGR
jgi:probable F420-dependent oxidoreductase